ncbi:MAG: acetolactate decarboxylase [Hyphomicrobium sp. 32-62-53]|nr:MAG: acetolactate decarboxylase [Hyphomicrobium sp. 12-62-95]OYX98014.1 MAG: acetolactate decarboxylase [Hyphomicrobium sp. 32-62-53]
MTRHPPTGPSPVYISAPIAALVEGIYRADTTIGHVRSKGDFGIGTFNDLDGEMVLLDGTVYCLRPQGQAEIIEDDVRTPFAIATHFAGDTVDRLEQPIPAPEFETALIDLIPSSNLFYSIRIDGRFTHVRARSVPKQGNYLPLAEITKVQTVFEFEDVTGTIVGFYTPSFLDSVHVPGFHLHFITADRSQGGHVLSVAPHAVTVRLQHIAAVELELPMTLDFLTMQRTRDVHADLAKVER